MNKHCYRLIFSRTHGELRVVSELARSCGTESGQTWGSDGGRLRVTLCRTSLLLWLALWGRSALADGIEADNTAQQNRRPDVISTQNGIPQVNITAPNESGISHNQYKQFDVEKQGAIFNNSAVMTSTQTAGIIQGNPNLDPNKAPARVILNEINSNNPSQIKGFLEVAGGKAQVIVANPSGIICNGCGTINAGRMTLTTGKPQFNQDGSLAGYQVEHGVIRVEGGGLNADSCHDTQYVDLLARAVEVNSGVWAKEKIAVVAGKNRVDSQNKATPIDSQTAQPEFAIDMGQMGGMYSGYIHMVGTEAGVGVRNQGGHIQADKTLTVSSNGKLSWGSASQQAITQTGSDITLTAKDALDHHGKLHSGGSLNVESQTGSVANTGTLAALKDVNINAKGDIHSQGNVLAGSDNNSNIINNANITLNSDDKVNSRGKLLSKQSVTAIGQSLDLSQTQIAASTMGMTAKQGDIALTQGKIDANNVKLNSARDIHAEQVQVKTHQWNVSANNLYSQKGAWLQTGQSESQFALTGKLNNQDGAIEANRLKLNADSLNNQNGRLVALGNTKQHWQVKNTVSNLQGEIGSNGDLSLTAGAVDNQAGTIKSQTRLSLNAKEQIDNTTGNLVAGNSVSLKAGQSLNNQSGTVNSQQVALATDNLINAQGKFISETTLDIVASRQVYNTNGFIGSSDKLTLATQALVNNQQGTVQSDTQLTVDAQHVDNQTGKIVSREQLILNSGTDVDNQSGTLYGTLVAIKANTINNRQGQVVGENTVDVKARNALDNTQGKVIANNALIASVGQQLISQAGLLQGGKQAFIIAQSLDNRDGQVLSGSSLNIATTANIINAQGEISSQNLNIKTAQLVNQAGKVIAGQNLALTSTDSVNNQAGLLEAGDKFTLDIQGDLYNQKGTLQAGQGVNLSAQNIENTYGQLLSGNLFKLNTLKDINNSGGKVSAGKILQWQGHHFNNDAGLLQSGGTLDLTGRQLNNQQKGQILSQDALSFTLTGDFNNQTGILTSQRDAAINANFVSNLQGAINSHGRLNVQVAQLIDNTFGSILSNQNQQINAKIFINQKGTVSSLCQIALNSTRLDNIQGTVISQQAGTYYIAQLNNAQGKIHSGNALTLTASDIQNQQGQLVSIKALKLIVLALDNRYHGILSSQGSLNLLLNALDNRENGLVHGSAKIRLTVNNIENTQGRLQSNDSLMFSGVNTLNNQSGQVLANGDIAFNTDAASASTRLALLNQQGTIQSGSTLAINTQSINNQGGTLKSQKALSLTTAQDYTHREGDTLTSNQSVMLTVAGMLTNLTDWLLPGDLTLSNLNLTNQGSLVSKTLNITTGKLGNLNRLEADKMMLNVDALNNSATLMGDDIRLNAKILDNQGAKAVIAAAKYIDLHTQNILTNRDQALIYSGDTLKLTSDNLIENNASFIEADGAVTLTARVLNNLRAGLNIQRDAEKSDYRWHRYNYNWRSYGSDVNTDKTTITPTTQKLTFKNDIAATTNPYGTLLTIDADHKRAQVRVKNKGGQLTDVWVNYLALTPDSDGSYAMTFYETRGWRQENTPTSYHNTVWREHDRGFIEQWDPTLHLDLAAIQYVTDYNNLRERSAEGILIRDKLISEGTGARILFSGDMILDIKDLLFNDASTITAAGDLHQRGNGRFENKSYSVNERRREHIIDHYHRNTGHWYPNFEHDETTTLKTIDGIISGNGNVVINGQLITNTTVNAAQISEMEAALNAVAAERAEFARNPLVFDIEGSGKSVLNTDFSASDKTPLTYSEAISSSDRPLLPSELALTKKQHIANVATFIPYNGLFCQNLISDSPFLVVTDKRFTDRDKFISSDYLLARVGYSPTDAHKRLGDGFYEQRLVREQVLKLTGRSSLREESAKAQYLYLMNNGINAAEDFRLRPGVALTPAQIAALRHDIVWLVSETVETQTVWVPKVYLANTTLRLLSSGAGNQR